MGLDPDGLVVVTGAGGFIGGWLVADLVARGHRRVRAVDLGPLERWHQRAPGADSRRLDLRRADACAEAVRGARGRLRLAEALRRAPLATLPRGLRPRDPDLELVGRVESIAGVTLERRYRLDAPRGVAGRNSDDDRIESALGWAPDTPLEVGLEPTYRWIAQQVEAASA
jgi:nucleoside-diphosphate-sugar epimerase